MRLAAPVDLCGCEIGNVLVDAYRRDLVVEFAGLDGGQRLAMRLASRTRPALRALTFHCAATFSAVMPMP